TVEVGDRTERLAGADINRGGRGRVETARAVAEQHLLLERDLVRGNVRDGKVGIAVAVEVGDVEQKRANGRVGSEPADSVAAQDGGAGRARATGDDYGRARGLAEGACAVPEHDRDVLRDSVHNGHVRRAVTVEVADDERAAAGGERRAGGRTEAVRAVAEQ